MTVGELVRRAREARGWTQTDLAREAGLRQTYISQVEGGEIALPREHNLDKLGMALGLSRADFYGAAGMLEGMRTDDASSPPSPLLRDSDTVPVAQMVAHIEARPGAVFQQRLAANRARLSPAAYVQWCVDYYRMTEGNATMVFNLYDERG